MEAGFTYCFTIVTVVLIMMEDRELTRFHCVRVLSVLVSVHYSKDHKLWHKVTKICFPRLPSQGI